MRRPRLGRTVNGLCTFDDTGALCLPELEQRIEPGEAVALLGARGTDISTLYERFNAFDPLHQQPGESANRTIWCVTRNGNLFVEFSALENFMLTERRILPYSRAELTQRSGEAKRRFGITTSLNTPLKQISVSERIIVDVLRAYLAGASVLVCDNLFSLLEHRDRAIFAKIAEDMTASWSALLYLTTKWESAVQIASRIVVFSENVLLGEADTQDVIRNPQNLIYLMSGKDLMQQPDNASQTANMLNMLYTGAEYVTKNMELRDALGFVLKNAVNLLQAAACTIHLADEQDGSLHLFSHPEHPAVTGIREEFARSRMQEQAAPPLYYLNDEDINFKQVFRAPPEGVRAFLCMPVVFNASVKGLFTVYFDHSVIYDEEQYLCLKSLCKETAIIIETSRLLGNSVLLQESNHRIKNNLQVVINLISVQKLYAANHPQVAFDNILDSIISRIQNIAYAHEMLSSRDTAGGRIDLVKILDYIIRPLSSSHIAIEVRSEDILIPYAKATSISMVINELVNNSLKYAFVRETPNPTITIACESDNVNLQITVRDNGCGFDVDGIDLDNPSGIGFSIVHTIVKMELRGDYKIRSSPRGTATVLTISLV